MIREYLRRGYRSVLPLLYARTKYKLFLNASLGEIDLRLQQLASVTDLFSSVIRPIPITAPFGRSMLVVAPHQDDEAIGCGGALALQAAAGAAAHIAVLQDGADGHEELGMTRQQLTELRDNESRRAAALIGIQPSFLHHASLTAEASKAATELADIVFRTHADAIFIPFPLDGHPDHRAANYILADALKDVAWDVRIFGYEIWSLCIPNVIVVIDEVMDRKMEMLACFAWANQAVDYSGSTRGLNMFRSRLLGAATCRFAECFFEIPRAEYIELVGKIKARERSSGLAPVSRAGASGADAGGYNGDR